jgi:O-antigen ligase
VNDDTARLALDARQKVIEQTALGLRIGLEALSLRLLTVLALVLTACMFAWSLSEPRWERLVASVAFAVFSYFVIHVKPKSEGD